jgi:phosphoribosylformylglycinamidine (FGAM) synthase-like enzyme
MAASAIDEAIRNCVAVGADPSRIAMLDNFCWGYTTDRPETLGSLVRAALACYDLAIAWHAVHQRQGQPQQRVQLHG